MSGMENNYFYTIMYPSVEYDGKIAFFPRGVIQDFEQKCYTFF